MTNIQQARDVFAKWREEADASEAQIDTDGELSLVDGTAGNLDLLNAIDWLLADELSWMRDNPDGWPRKAITDVAAAIIAAAERMSA